LASAGMRGRWRRRCCRRRRRAVPLAVDELLAVHAETMVRAGRVSCRLWWVRLRQTSTSESPAAGDDSVSRSQTGEGFAEEMGEGGFAAISPARTSRSRRAGHAVHGFRTGVPRGRPISRSPRALRGGRARDLSGGEQLFGGHQGASADGRCHGRGQVGIEAFGALFDHGRLVSSPSSPVESISWGVEGGGRTRRRVDPRWPAVLSCVRRT